MKIAACYKLVPVNDQITVSPDRTLNLEKAEWEIGAYDLNAVEAAVSLAAQCGASVTALTVAGKKLEDTKLRKAILSRGPAELFGVSCEQAEELDGLATASLLKAAVEASGDLDLVICGEGSVDQYAQQVGPMLGTLLGWNSINAVNKLEWRDGALYAERELEDETEQLVIPLPAVISVTTAINRPRIPSMRDILGAGKKPVTVKPADELCAALPRGCECVSVLAPEQTERLQVVWEDESDESIAAFCEQIRKVI